MCPPLHHLKRTVLVILVWPSLVLATDTDGDGVSDGTDVCCNTPPGIAVDVQGRPKGDLDGDCDVDQSDFGIFQANITGAMTPCTAPEVCDGLDNDCNCRVDDNPADGSGSTWYPDQDGDGYGATASPIRFCSHPGPGYSQTPGDCDDQNATVHPQVCDPTCQDPDEQNCTCTNVNTGNISCGVGECSRVVSQCVNGSANTCTPGTPSPEICDNQDNDCNGIIDDGVDTQADLNNCGTCGNVCPNRPNSTRVCNNGTCGISCNTGFRNCDGNASNGCEVNVFTSTANCGTCGNVCPPRANATPVCNNGTCGFTCNSGFDDCNNNASDGCEVNLMTDENNCGSCRHLCPGFLNCLNGICN